MFKFILSTFLILLLQSCGPQKQNDNKKIRVLNPVIDKTKLLASELLIKPIDAKKNHFKALINKNIFQNQISSHLISGNLCFLFDGENKFSAFGLKAIDITLPSANEYKIGRYYDAMMPLSKTNCGEFDFGVLELKENFNNEYLKINLTKKPIDYQNSISMFIPLEPYPFNMGINRNIYVNGEEALAIPAMQTLNDYQVQPIKNWLEPYSNARDQNFTEYVKNYQISKYINTPMLGELNLLDTENYTPWFYVFDEPTESYLPTLRKDLKRLKNQYPSIKRMVTTHYRDNLEIDIYCEVAEYLTQKEINLLKQNNKEIWMYISCMSHGCGPGRVFQDNPNQRIPSPYEFRSGAPDLSIETSAIDIYMLYALTIKYPIKALLYYNSIEQWNLSQFNVNPFKDMYNFGGNGDGTLLYPDFENKSHYPSLRLALMREASYFHFALSRSKHKNQVLDKIKSTIDWNLEITDIIKVFDSIE